MGGGVGYGRYHFRAFLSTENADSQCCQRFFFLESRPNHATVTPQENDTIYL